MRTSKIKTPPLLFITLILSIILSCRKEDNEINLPVLSTSEISEITGNFAKSGGNIIDDGGNTVTERGVCWSINANPTIVNNKTVDGAGGGIFISNLTNLEPGTSYFVRAYASSKNGTGYGMTLSFTTLIVGPTVNTNQITNITDISASCGGEIISDGASEITARGVCWNTNPNPTLSDNHTIDGTGTGMFTSNITGIEPATRYYVRAYATNKISTEYGSEVEFITNSGKPVVTTSNITNITGLTATCGGNITNNGGESIKDRGVVWSTFTNPTIDNNNGITHDGNSLGLFSSTILGLNPKTKYYVKAYATNNQGTSYGEQFDFITISWGQLSDFSGSARYNAFSFVYDNIAYIGTGNGSQGELVDIWKYNYLNDTWTYLCDFPGGAREKSFAFVINGKAYIGAGREGQKDMWEYDILNNTWKQKSSFSNFLYQLSFSANNKGYILGNDKDNGNTLLFNEYTPETDSWISKSIQSSENHTYPIFFVKNNKAYVGIDRNARQIFLYDINNDTWTYETTFPGEAWTSTSSIVIGDYAYIIGGYVSKEVWQYNMNSKSWQQLEDLPDVRYEAVSFIINNIAYFGTGISSHGPSRDIWKFFP